MEFRNATLNAGLKAMLDHAVGGSVQIESVLAAINNSASQFARFQLATTMMWLNKALVDHQLALDEAAEKAKPPVPTPVKLAVVPKKKAKKRGKK